MIYVATQPVDFRKGAEGLALLAKETLGYDPMKGGQWCPCEARRSGEKSSSGMAAALCFTGSGLRAAASSGPLLLTA